LATRALSYLADEHSNQFPNGAKIIKSDFYVDDLITGGSTLESIENIRQEVNAILKSGQMELKKWYSNDQQFLSEIPEDDREKLISIEGTSVLKTLGICWQPTTDEFRFVVPKEIQTCNKISKRTVLGDIARLFDPLGLINPIIVWAKIFMQNLWLLRLDWDESLPMDLHTSWENFKTQLSKLNEVQIPRFVFCLSEIDYFDIHGFADASLRAYVCYEPMPV
jgi:hypothetical protein